MKKKRNDISSIKQKVNPTIAHPRTFGEKASDILTTIMGSWTFILFFMIILIAWILINSYYLIEYSSGKPFDPYPFILLNLALSCLAAIQAPIILMSQNRQTQKDRIRSEYDYAVNRKAEHGIVEIKKQLDRIERKRK